MKQRKGRIQWHAVLMGYVVDFLITLVIGGIGLALEPSIATGAYFSTPTGTVIGVLLALSVAVGGWIAGRIARTERFLHGFLVGGLGIIMLLVGGFFDSPASLDSIVLQFAATGLAGLAGQLSQWPAMRERKK
jgi:putative membrane protein (TIGR04086 family)